MTRIVLVRHGQTEWNRVERFRGRFDVPLNEHGAAQAEATGTFVRETFEPAAVYTSPLSRAVKTAEAIGRPIALASRIHPELVDINYGTWQGLFEEEVKARWPVELEQWYEAPQRAVIPDGETLRQVRERAMRAVRELADRHEGETIVLVSHTVVNRVILLSVADIGLERFWKIRQDTCAVNVFEAGGGDFVLVTLNGTYHLRKLAR